MAGAQIVRLTKEVTYNAFPGSPAGGTQQDVFLPVGNAMTMRPMPQFTPIRDAGFGNRLIRKIPGRTNLAGSLTTHLFASQAAYFLGLIDLTGTPPCLDIPSFAVDHLLILPTGCVSVPTQTTGCKVAKMQITADQSEGGMLAMLKMDIMGSTPRTSTLTAPALSAYPSDDPFEFFDLAGHVTIGSSRTNLQSMTLDIANVLKAFPDENRYVQSIGWFGREVTLTAKLLHKSNADRAAFQNGTKQAVSIEFSKGVTAATNLTLNLQGVCNIDSVGDDDPIDDYFTQTITLTALMDPASTAGPSGSATDFSFVVGTDA